MPRNSTTPVAFRQMPLHRKWEPHPLYFLAERSSFWIATLSVIAFLVGNMVGQHGWYAFWHSVWGEGSDLTIAYTGTVTPVDRVPDYVRWAQEYGGNPHTHTFQQVPRDLLVPLPSYNTSLQHEHMAQSPIGQIYSVGYMGAYDTGGDSDGSHAGVDIRLPVGTPIRSIANGIISEVKNAGGFGMTVVIKHPNMPSPSGQGTETLYSSYAHLSATYIEEGTYVQKGQRIALSGATGTVSGPHLHFQIDHENAPWHPYWPFSTDELRRAGLSSYQAVNSGFMSTRGFTYTISPMVYVQSNPSVMVVAHTDAADTDDSATNEPDRPLTFEEQIALLQGRALQRAQERLARSTRATPTPVAVAQPPQQQEQSDVVDVRTRSAVVDAVADTYPVAPPMILERSNGITTQSVASVAVYHAGSFSGRNWETVTVKLLDAGGNAVRYPVMNTDVHMRTAYGSAEFRPAVLKASDFVNGEATVQMLPRGRGTVVIIAQPFGVLSAPMVYR